MREGTPQGAGLSPLQFLLFISGIAGDFPSGVEITLSADDLAIFASERTIAEAKTTVQAALDELLKWADRWKMEISADKTMATVFTLDPMRRSGGPACTCGPPDCDTNRRRPSWVLRSTLSPALEREADVMPFAIRRRQLMAVATQRHPRDLPGDPLQPVLVAARPRQRLLHDRGWAETGLRASAVAGLGDLPRESVLLVPRTPPWESRRRRHHRKRCRETDEQDGPAGQTSGGSAGDPGRSPASRLHGSGSHHLPGRDGAGENPDPCRPLDLQLSRGTDGA